MNTAAEAVASPSAPDYAIRTQKLNLWNGTFQALFDVDLEIQAAIEEKHSRDCESWKTLIPGCLPAHAT